ncbi:polyhydroxyalkanoate synthesis regulator DNA-binding domain-containing protein [Kitasatospora sp. NPDC058201]|uniref:polyhydroxyalkanoate synthesis regulator DNA-binding domain-containing protein n=1 Tax=unclassified Kitasatospora TaxID=2633591 RepID=UPI003646D4AA
MPPEEGAEAERLLVRMEGGRLLDARTRRPVTLEALADDVRRGRCFRVRDGESGVEYTYQVLAQVLLTALAPVLPGHDRRSGRPPGPARPLLDVTGDGFPPDRDL